MFKSLFDQSHDFTDLFVSSSFKQSRLIGVLTVLLFLHLSVT